MKRINNLASNLKAYKKANQLTWVEMSEQFGISKSTLQSAMIDGNTTVDTLVRIANATQQSLDELVFSTRLEHAVLQDVTRYCQLPIPVQRELCRYLRCISDLLEANDG